MIERAEEHLGTERAGRYLRKFYPWYAERLGLTRKASNEPPCSRPKPRQHAARPSCARSCLSEAPPEPVLHCSVPPAGSSGGVFLCTERHVLTPQGLDELEGQDRAPLRPSAGGRSPQRIKEAREFGDIAENSEYDDAKNEQAMLEKQIADLEEKLRCATVIDEK